MILYISIINNYNIPNPSAALPKRIESIWNILPTGYDGRDNATTTNIGLPDCTRNVYNKFGSYLLITDSQCQFTENKFKMGAMLILASAEMSAKSTLHGTEWSGQRCGAAALIHGTFDMKWLVSMWSLTTRAIVLQYAIDSPLINHAQQVYQANWTQV